MSVGGAAAMAPRRWLAAVVVITAGAAHAAGGGEAAATARLYLVHTQTGMPHLDENLRYAVRQTRQCLDARDLSRVFWMLDDPSLQDCRLLERSRDAASVRYELQCTGGHGTSGEATWGFDAGKLDGTLRVRLGGKNMTFYQRVTATPVGDC